MNIEGSKVLVLGGYGLVGMAVCRELLEHKPREIQIHSLRQEESEEALELLLPFAQGVKLSVSSGDIFGLTEAASRIERIAAQLKPLREEDWERFLLYRLLVDGKPDIVIDSVNTATGIAYRDVYSASAKVLEAWKPATHSAIRSRICSRPSMYHD